MEPLVDETYFPDAALRQAVISQVGPYVTDLSGFTGVLDCKNTEVKDLTGIAQYLPGLTGLNLTGTKVTKLTSDMLPTGLETLNLTNCRALTLWSWKTIRISRWTSQAVSMWRTCISPAPT